LNFLIIVFLCLVTGIYDLTVGFKNTGAEPTLRSIMKGRSCQAEMFLRRIPISDIPKDTEGCSDWVYNLYQEKDQIYDYFVRHNTFEGNGLERLEIPRNYYDLFIQLTWMVIIGIPSIIYLFQFLWTSSFFAQIIFVILIILGKRKKNEFHMTCCFCCSNNWCTSNDCCDRNGTRFTLW
jgi:hypothetical protein